MNLTPVSSTAAIDPSADTHPAVPLAVDNCPRILLVDDEPRLLSSLYELLRDRDYHLVTATCGSEALAQPTLRSMLQKGFRGAKVAREDAAKP